MGHIPKNRQEVNSNASRIQKGITKYREIIFLYRESEK